MSSSETDREETGPGSGPRVFRSPLGKALHLSGPLDGLAGGGTRRGNSTVSPGGRQGTPVRTEPRESRRRGRTSEKEVWGAPTRSRRRREPLRWAEFTVRRGGTVGPRWDVSWVETEYKKDRGADRTDGALPPYAGVEGVVRASPWSGPDSSLPEAPTGTCHLPSSPDLDGVSVGLREPGPQYLSDHPCHDYDPSPV